MFKRVSNCFLIIQKMLVCEDAKYPKLTEMNVNSNAYNEFNDGFKSTLRNACNRSETGVSIRAMQYQYHMIQCFLLRILII